MKTKFFTKFLILLSAFGFITNSCNKDEGFHEVSALEQKIHEKINDHRLENQLPALVFQPLLFKEARKHSISMSNSGEITNEGLDAVFDDLISKIGGDIYGYIVDTNQYAVADSVVKRFFSDTEIEALTLCTFTQAGVGVYAGTDKVNYITVMFLNIPE